MHPQLNWGDLVLERSQVSVAAVVADVASFDVLIDLPCPPSVRQIPNVGCLVALADWGLQVSFGLE